MSPSAPKRVARFVGQKGAVDAVDVVEEPRGLLRCGCGGRGSLVRPAGVCRHIRVALVDRNARLPVGEILVEARRRGTKPVEMTKLGRGRWREGE